MKLRRVAVACSAFLVIVSGFALYSTPAKAESLDGTTELALDAASASVTPVVVLDPSGRPATSTEQR